MNANCYRIVFNHARGLVMAVAETACAQGKSPATTTGPAITAPPGFSLARLRPTAFAALLALGAQLALVPLASAQVVAYRSAPASQQPTVLSAGNGVPLINIQTPSAAGVSRNTYEQFDVQTQGIILNNSRTNTATQLGGWVQGNPWLATGSARVILNEVVSGNPSQLLGYVEVAGNAAQVVIANPAGVTCNGCGFINASRTTLTTGTPQLSGGTLDGYRVEGGTIRIEGAGMDASGVGYTDLIARAVEVNAGIWAQTLKVTAGTNVVSADNAQATPIAGSGAAPAFAIDVAQLGGMYAGKIVLVGTEAGVGVRNAGYLGASAGEVVVTADGRLTNSGSIVAAGKVGVDARAGITNTGTVYAQGDLGFATAGDIENAGGLIAASGNATLAASGAGSRISGDADSIFAAGMASDGSLSGSGRLDMSASERIATSGRQLAGGDLAMSARSLDLADSVNSGRNVVFTASTGNLDLSRATTVAGGALTLRAAQALIHEAARTSAEGDASLFAEEVRNHQGRIGAGGTLSIETGGSVDNSEGLLFAAGTLNIAAANVDNRSGALQAADNLDVQASGAIDNRAGLIRSGQAVTLTAASVDNAGTLGTDQGIEGQSVSLTARDIGNAGGAMRTTANLTLSADRSLDNTGGLLSAGDTLAIADSSTAGRNLAIANAGGTMIADQLIDIDAASLAGQGEILGLQDVGVKLASDTVHSGRLVANRNASFETAGTLDNSGSIEVGNALTVTAATLNNTATGSLKGSALQLTATDINTLTNRGLIDGADTRIDAVTLNNLGTGRIYGDTVSIAATTLTNEAEAGNAPVIAARSRLDLGITTLANRDGALLFSAGDLAIGGALDANRRATGAATSIENTGAGIESLGGMAIDAASLINQRRTLTIALDAYQDASSRSWTRCDNGSCSYWTDIVQTTTHYQDEVTASTPAAFIRAGGNATFAVGDLINRYSTIEAGGDLTLTGNTLVNEGAELYQRTDVVTSEHHWHYKNGLKDHGTSVSASSTSTLTDTVPAVISAGGSLTGSYTGLIDNVAIRQNTAPQVPGSGTTVPALAAGTAGTGATAIGRVPVGSGQSVVSANPNLAVPANNLFHQTRDPSARYLIETDPKFASYRQWLSSDYMLTQLSLDPATTQKRLGDGFYEQRLITEQIAQLTGRRFLTGYTNDEAQYQALMEAGATFAKEWQLVPGIALSAEQMARLTSDIVWLVEKEVAGQKVLVPQVYARVKDGDLAPSGALLAGANVTLGTAADLVNSGRIAGRQVVSLNAENIRNLGGDVAGKEIYAAAKADLLIKGGSFTAENRLIASAGRDLTVESSTVDLTFRAPGVNGSVRRTDINRVAGLYVTGENGTLVASADRDLSLLAAAIVNGTAGATPAGGNTLLSAGRDLTLGTVTESRDAATSSKKNRWSESASSEVGSSIQTAGSLMLLADNDLAIKAAYVQSGGAIGAQAGRDLTISAGQASYASEYFHQGSGGGFLSKKTTTVHNTTESTSAVASTLSGDSVTLLAGRDIAVKGSNVVATNDITLSATRNLSIEAATETHNETSFRSTKQSGVFSSGGVGFTLGSRQQSTNQKTEATTAVKSTIGSIDGNVLLLAGENYRQVGSDVLAVKGDIDIRAKTVDILEARETSKSTAETRSKQSGLTLAITSPVISAIQTVQQVAEVVPKAKDARLQAIAATTTGLAVKNAVDAVAADPLAGGGVGISITVGGSKSQNTTTQTSNTAAASTLTAGQNITITASGAGAQSDITIQGSNVSAARNIALSADDEIRLLAARNDSSLERDSKGSSAGVGLAITYGSNGFAAGITANASASKGNADGQDTTWSNTRIVAGNLLTLESGGDTTLKGAVASGKQIVADIGGDLKIESLQDTSTYKRQDGSVGGSVTVGYGFAASANVGQQKIDSDFASVTEQSGLKAGDGGFDIRVKNNTDLKGAVIASTEQAAAEGLNRLETGTLTTSNLQNKAEYEASSINIGFGYSQGSSMVPLGDNKGPASGGVGANQQGQTSTGGQTPGSLLPDLGGFSAGVPGTMSAKDDAKSTTQSGISAAVITLTDETKQQALTGKNTEQTLASLNTNVATGKDTTNALKPIFDEQKIEAEFAIVGAFSREMGTFLVNWAKEADSKNAQAEMLEQQAKDSSLPIPDEQRLALLDQARNLRTEAQSISDNWGAGGTYRQIATALTAAASGNVSAASSEFVRDMLVNYVQQQGATYIGQLVADGTLTEGSPLHAALHGILACAGAAASNQGCAGGASGAAASSLLTGLFSETNPNETNAEREAKRNLIVSIVTGLAAGSGNATTATNAAVAAVDNNWLATQQIVQMKKELAAADGLLATAKVAAKWAYISGKQDVLTTAGIGKGLAESGWNDVKGLAEFLSDPVKGLQGIKDIIDKPEVRQQLGESIFRELDIKIGRMQMAIDQGGDQNAEQFGKDLGSLVWQVGSVATGAMGVAKGGVALVKAGVSVGTSGFEAMKLAASLLKAEGKGLGGVVGLGETGMEFGAGIARQGKPFEAFVQTKLPEGTLDLNSIKSNFSTFDHLTPDGVAVSSKTLDTVNSTTYTQRPASITSTLNGYVDDMVNFPGDGKGKFELANADISSKQMQLGISYNTTAEQMAAIAQSIQYAQSLRPPIQIIVTRIK